MAAFFWSLIALAVPLVISPSSSSSSTQLNPETSAYPISTFLTITNSPPIPPFQELSPDIAPLLPSPGGELPSPATSSIPTIPSSPSPPNPDEAVASGPDSAFSPLGALLASSAAPRNLINLVVAVVGLVAYRSIQLFQILLISASLEKLVPLQSGQVTGVAMNVACQERFLRSWSGNWIPAGTWF
ncbi:hypothetical protein OIU85_005414 [Salix viminalis]|uniref:Classical arabinogalactan protein 26-like n=1 Tax=Salix viminalis TaxID=40686 RepID=A0A9Q0PIQ8_SALVM|nr:hypothetical protein OIU85_005414 [Salix viminalis]